jgi:hypothetical protein
MRIDREHPMGCWALRGQKAFQKPPRPSLGLWDVPPLEVAIGLNVVVCTNRGWSLTTCEVRDGFENVR